MTEYIDAPIPFVIGCDPELWEGLVRHQWYLSPSEDVAVVFMEGDQYIHYKTE